MECSALHGTSISHIPLSKNQVTLGKRGQKCCMSCKSGKQCLVQDRTVALMKSQQPWLPEQDKASQHSNMDGEGTIELLTSDGC